MRKTKLHFQLSWLRGVSLPFLLFSMCMCMFWCVNMYVLWCMWMHIYGLCVCRWKDNHRGCPFWYRVSHWPGTCHIGWVNSPPIFRDPVASVYLVVLAWQAGVMYHCTWLLMCVLGGPCWYLCLCHLPSFMGHVCFFVCLYWNTEASLPNV